MSSKGNYLWHTVIEGELAIEHGEEHHPQGPHVTRLAQVGLSAQHVRRDVGRRAALILQQVLAEENGMSIPYCARNRKKRAMFRAKKKI
jgi:hypothetical protein